MANLVDFLYTASSIPDAINLYSDALLTEGTLYSIQHAQKLIEFRDHYVMDRIFISHLRDEVFNNLYDLIDKQKPDLRFFIEGRRKSLIKTEEKICLYGSRMKSLDLLRDMMAFRIILFGQDTKDLIKDLYDVLDIVISFCIRNGFVICDAEPIGINLFTPEENRIIVPEEKYVNPEWESCIKDYVRYPKANGYQSLHVVFRQPDGRCFEVQIRTMDMHIRCEIGSTTNHKVHNENKYSNRIAFDPSKISMDGFYYSKDTQQILDYIGLYKSAQVILRRKSF